MIGKLRERMKRLGVVMTFLALLFAATGPMEAMACAAEGCAPPYAEQVDGAAASDASGQPSDDCNDRSCACAIGHCGHVFSVPVTTVETTDVPRTAEPSAPVGAQPFTSASIQGLERPPRA